MTVEKYVFEVSVDQQEDIQSGEPPRQCLTFEDAADAIAAWSKGITDGAEYVVIEALRVRAPAGWASKLLAPEQEAPHGNA